MAETVFDLVEYKPIGAPITQNATTNKIIGTILGSVGALGASAVAVAAIMSPKVSGIGRYVSGDTAKKLWAGFNIIFQIMETFLRNYDWGNVETKGKVMSVLDFIDQGLDLSGIMINDSGLRALFGKPKSSRNSPY
jgi:hypothetical protein